MYIGPFKSNIIYYATNGAYKDDFYDGDFCISIFRTYGNYEYLSFSGQVKFPSVSDQNTNDYVARLQYIIINSKTYYANNSDKYSCIGYYYPSDRCYRVALNDDSSWNSYKLSWQEGNTSSGRMVAGEWLFNLNNVLFRRTI